MCRHLAYLGDPVTLRSAIIDPPHGLAVQALAPRRQLQGVVNVDAFGIGWYAAPDPVPARYRRAGPIWADETLADLARVTRTGALLAAVRSATPGTEPGAAAAAPYAADTWLFSHNGAVSGWPTALSGLAARLSPADLLTLEARCDSAVIWALVLGRLRAGAALADALTAVLGELAAARVTGRFNLLLTDGQAIAATAAGNTLCYRHEPGRVVVASEPSDDQPGWHDVPDGSVVEATVRSVRVRPIPAAANPAAAAANPAAADTRAAGVAAAGSTAAGQGGRQLAGLRGAESGDA
jgi:glutamine amidotransferase